MSAGWKSNPVVGIGLAALVVVSGCLVCSRMAGKGRGPDPLAGDTVTLICPHDGEVFRVPKVGLGLSEGADQDEIMGKAQQTPCPKCTKADGVLPVYCPECGKPFATPKGVAKAKDITCPHCGAKPWARE